VDVQDALQLGKSQLKSSGRKTQRMVGEGPAADALLTPTTSSHCGAREMYPWARRRMAALVAQGSFAPTLIRAWLRSLEV